MLFVYDDRVFCKNMVINANIRAESVELEGILRDLISVVKAVYVFLCQSRPYITHH